MRIGLNATIATTTRTGTGHYAANLTRALMNAEHGHEMVVYCGDDMAAWFTEQRNGRYVSIVPVRIRGAVSRIIWEQSRLNAAVTKQKIDVLHNMAFSSPLQTRVPTVVTVHDLAFHRDPSLFPVSRRLYYKALFEHSARTATRVVTPSETIRKEVIEEFRLPGSRVIAVPEAAGPEFSPGSGEQVARVRAELGLHKPYFLAVGTIDPRKNLLTLIRAFDAARRESGLEHVLVLAGKQGWQQLSDLPEFQSLLETAAVVCAGYVPQSKMPGLYSGAEALLFPSRYEGFGIPLVEAFACGTPVVASDIPVHREVAADAALFAYPDDPGQWHSLIVELARNGRLRKRLKTLGFRRSHYFSWQKTAETMLEVYHSLF